MVHGLVAVTQAIQDVAHRCHVKVFANELFDSVSLANIRGSSLSYNRLIGQSGEQFVIGDL